MVLERFFTLRRPDRERIVPPVWARRLAALVAVVVYPALLLGLEADLSRLQGVMGPVGLVATMAVLVVGWVASFGVIHAFRRQLAQAPDHQLDERERRVRDEAHLIGYRLLVLALTLCTAWALFVAPFFGADREVSLDVVLSVFFSLVVMSVALPSAVVAWRDTDVDGLDPDDADGAPLDGAPLAERVR